MQRDAPRAVSGALHDGEAPNAHERLQPVELLQHSLGEAAKALHRFEEGRFIGIGVATGRDDLLAISLEALPDDAFQQVVAACGNTDTDEPPFFEAVKGLGCLSKGMLQQLHRLQPLVGVRSLAVVQRPAHGPWRVTLLASGRTDTPHDLAQFATKADFDVRSNPSLLNTGV